MRLRGAHVGVVGEARWRPSRVASSSPRSLRRQLDLAVRPDQRRRRIPGGGEQLVAVGVIDRAGERPVAGRATATLTHHWGMREQEVDGAVERVHDPVEPAACPRRPRPPRRRSRRAGRRLGEQLADRLLGGQVGLADEVCGRALGADVMLGAGARALDEQRAGQRPPRRPSQQLRRPVRPTARSHAASVASAFAHENSGGRCCGPRALGLDLARRATAAWPRRRAVRRVCTARGSPSAPKPAGTDAAGWPVTFQTPL